MRIIAGQFDGSGPNVQAVESQSPRNSYLATLCVVSLVLWVAWVVTHQLRGVESRGLVYSLSRAVSFGNENNIAAWWSGTLLFMAGLHALDSYKVQIAAGWTKLGQAWLVMAATLFAMSCTEVGSFHERVPRPVLAVVAVPVLLCMAWAFWQLWLDLHSRLSAVWLWVAFALFAGSIGQEYVSALPDWFRGWPGPVEEGVELIAMLLLVAVTSRNSSEPFTAAGASRPTPWMVHSMPSLPLMSVVAAAPLVVALTVMLPDQQRGHPSDWLAAMLLLLAALSVSSGCLSNGPAHDRGRFVVGLLLLTASAVSVAMPPQYVLELGGLAVNQRLAALASLAAVLFVDAWLSGAPEERRCGYVWLVLGCATAAAAVSDPGRLLTYAVTTGFSVASYLSTAPNVRRAVGPRYRRVGLR